MSIFTKPILLVCKDRKESSVSLNRPFSIPTPASNRWYGAFLRKPALREHSSPCIPRFWKAFESVETIFTHRILFVYEVMRRSKRTRWQPRSPATKPPDPHQDSLRPTSKEYKRLVCGFGNLDRDRGLYFSVLCRGNHSSLYYFTDVFVKIVIGVTRFRYDCFQ